MFAGIFGISMATRKAFSSPDLGVLLAVGFFLDFLFGVTLMLELDDVSKYKPDAVGGNTSAKGGGVTLPFQVTWPSMTHNLVMCLVWSVASGAFAFAHHASANAALSCTFLPLAVTCWKLLLHHGDFSVFPSLQWGPKIGRSLASTPSKALFVEIVLYLAGMCSFWPCLRSQWNSGRAAVNMLLLLAGGGLMMLLEHVIMASTVGSVPIAAVRLISIPFFCVLGRFTDLVAWKKLEKRRAEVWRQVQSTGMAAAAGGRMQQTTSGAGAQGVPHGDIVKNMYTSLLQQRNDDQLPQQRRGALGSMANSLLSAAVGHGSGHETIDEDGMPNFENLMGQDNSEWNDVLVEGEDGSFISQGSSTGPGAGMSNEAPRSSGLLSDSNFQAENSALKAD